ncbi:DUF3515 domain-containing protein [Kibdelosporangium philippinense]|uniref:DUF3515 domain-containing protein n=1 Tax=Kibdelosporangium philippinense TaxID=211113 RepID=A0ABS8ZK12_9PSEU|nr:DUF3515 domain-containing protein [Kibdelosporangium philippinense]MCE7007822.1 DUF3515 domain-containing protein [Kibdelosporangium philippinense]
MDRPRILIAAGLAGLLVVGVIIVAIVFGSRTDELAEPAVPPAPLRTGPVALVPVPAPNAGSADCTTLVQKVPATLQSGSTTLTKAALAEPAPPASVAWTDQRSDPIVLRCGLDKPAELKPDTQNLRAIDGVAWLPIDSETATTWYLADRPVYVALTIPRGTGTGPLQDISSLIGKTLTKKPL